MFAKMLSHVRHATCTSFHTPTNISETDNDKISNLLTFGRVVSSADPLLSRISFNVEATTEIHPIIENMPGKF